MSNEAHSICEVSSERGVPVIDMVLGHDQYENGFKLSSEIWSAVTAVYCQQS